MIPTPSLTRRFLCWLGFHRLHAYASDDLEVFFCKHCEFERLDY